MQNSQDSQGSSNVSRLPSLVMNTSDLSTMTIETESTSPSSIGPSSAMTRPKLVRLSSMESSSDERTSTDGSINSLYAAGAIKGSKRTASGVIKRSPDSEEQRFSARERKAAEVSFALEYCIRAANLKQDLKTRLKYAMFKISNGLEQQSIEQIESLPPSSPASRFSRRASISSDGYMLSPIGAPSPSRHFHDLSRDKALPSSAALMAVSGASSDLPPEPILTERRLKRRTWNGRPPPVLSKSSMKQSSLGQQEPLTPTAAQPLFHNQAEKDAVDSLLFMSSPNNSANMKHARPKKVDFEIPYDRYR